MKIAVIPARGGSKRIPRKNIKGFFGRPMIAWSIAAARTSGLFDRIIVSTDDPEIAEISRGFGAEAPFMRPAALSDDHAGTTAVVAHATKWALDDGCELDGVCCIYATAPFLVVDDLKRGWEALQSGAWDFAFSVTDYSSPIFRAFRIAANGGVEMVFPGNFETRSQDLPQVLHDAALFYWGRPTAWLDEKRVFSINAKPVVIPRWRVQDIDTDEDWRRAEILAPLVMQREMVDLLMVDPAGNERAT